MTVGSLSGSGSAIVSATSDGTLRRTDVSDNTLDALGCVGDGDNAVCYGPGANATGTNTSALGAYSTASATGATSTGAGAKASGANALPLRAGRDQCATLPPTAVAAATSAHPSSDKIVPFNVSY